MIFCWFLRNACKHILFIHYVVVRDRLISRSLQVPLHIFRIGYLVLISHKYTFLFFSRHVFVCFFVWFSFSFFFSSFSLSCSVAKWKSVFYSGNRFNKKNSPGHILPLAKRLHDNLNRIVWFTTENPLTGVKWKKKERFELHVTFFVWCNSIWLEKQQ